MDDRNRRRSGLAALCQGQCLAGLGGDANTVYSGTDVVPLASQVTQLELGGGVTGRINANISVFANVDYEFAVGAAEDKKRYGVRGAFGARYTW